MDHQNLEHDLQLCHKELVENVKNNTIPEVHFKSVFLPVFTGQRQPHEDENIVQLWVSLAGGWDRSMDVIDSNGKVLITVPPIFSTSNYKVDYDEWPSLFELSRMVNRGPALLQDTSEFSNMIDTVIEARSTGKTVADEWRRVLEYYNILPGNNTDVEQEDDFLAY